MSWRDELAAAARTAGVADRAATLAQFVELFAQWNARINLSAARTHDAIAEHVVDSAAVLGALPESGSVVDVGSGGGFPALIVAALRPSLSVRCLEPIHKKTAFLATAVRTLDLSNVDILTRRVDPEIDRGFDAAMSRATFALDEWLAIGSRLVRAGGVVIGMEARDQVELGPDDERQVYQLTGRQRALIVRRVR